MLAIFIYIEASAKKVGLMNFFSYLAGIVSIHHGQLAMLNYHTLKQSFYYK